MRRLIKLVSACFDSMEVERNEAYVFHQDAAFGKAACDRTMICRLELLIETHLRHFGCQEKLQAVAVRMQDRERLPIFRAILGRTWSYASPALTLAGDRAKGSGFLDDAVPAAENGAA